MDALRQVERWPAPHVAVAVLDGEGRELGAVGPRARVFQWASVTKLVVAYACLIAAEEGVIDLDEAAGPPGSTVRHLLAHASGLPFEPGPPIARPGTRRIYSNAGYELLAAHLEARAEMPFDRYLHDAVLAPLQMHAELAGSPAHGLRGSLEALLAFAHELVLPRLVARETLAEATAVVFPRLVGVLPEFGRMEPNDWGLGFELKDAKHPHWTSLANSPATFGHFGGSGTFVWVDPQLGLACACLTDREFGDWAKEAWPRLSDAVIAEARR